MYLLMAVATVITGLSGLARHSVWVPAINSALAVGSLILAAFAWQHSRKK